jgi:hypothetical protein
MNDQAIAINFGAAVARSAADNTCKAPTVDSDMIIGIALRHAIMPTLGRGDGGTNLVQYAQNSSVPVLRNGFVYAVPVENVNRGDKVVSITAGNGTLGSAANDVLATAVAATAGNAKATGTVTMTNQALAGDTVTINGVVFTFVASGAVYPQVNLGTTKQLTAANLQAALESSINPLLTGAEYTVSGAVVTVTEELGGTAGNAFTLATSDSTNIAVSAATLASGAANTGNATIALGGQPTEADAETGVFDIVCLTATTANVYSPTGRLLGVATFGTQFNNVIVFTITAGGTPCVAGDSFTVTVALNAGRPLVPNATWESTVAAGVIGVIRINN